MTLDRAAVLLDDELKKIARSSYNCIGVKEDTKNLVVYCKRRRLTEEALQDILTEGKWMGFKVECIYIGRILPIAK